MPTELEPQQIDIGRILAEKAGRKFPRLLISLLEALIHQREINEILTHYNAYSGVDFMNCLIEYFHIDIDWVYPDRLPHIGRVIFAANHPLGGLDGICLSHLIGRAYGDVRYIVNDLLCHLRPLRSIFLPVNKLGAQAREAVRAMNEAMAGSLPICTFPAGFCSRKISGRIQDISWSKNFVRQSILHNRDIVPVYFHGRNSHRFYTIEQLRSLLRIGFNPGTVLLPDEMFRARGKRFRAVVGQPISWQQLAESPLSEQHLARQIRQTVYELGSQAQAANLLL